MRTTDKTKPGWNIPVVVRDKFVEFCSSVGAVAQDDCAGALLVWLVLPPDVREFAKKQAKNFDENTDTKPIYCWLVDELLDKVVSDNLAAAGISRQEVLSLLKRAAEQKK